MKNKTGSKTQGKSASGTRMAIVLRFLAGTQPEEIQFFLDLLSEPVKHFKNGSYSLPLTKCTPFVATLDVPGRNLCNGLLPPIPLMSLCGNAVHCKLSWSHSRAQGC